jgi:starch-binding outer membrane protein, SusD/RagB family
MKKYIATVIAGVALIGACKDSTAVPDYNNPSLSEVLGKPLTKIGLQNLVTGYHDSQRASLGVAPANYIVFGEVMSRDGYRTDASESRYVNEFLNGTPDPSAFSGGGNWTAFMRDIRAANTILQVLPSIPATENVSDAQKSAVKGMVRTMKAIDYYKALEYRDTLGVPVALDIPLGAPLAPILCKPKVSAYVSALLDSAYADLQAAGTATFPVKLPPGFAGFNTPATFALFNRGWKGKVELYRALDHTSPTGTAGFTAALAALNASYINTTDPAQIGTGVYFSFSTNTGDTPNQLVDGNLHLNPQISDSLQAGDRRGSKIIAVTPATIQGLTYKSNFRVAQTDPIAYLKNEELILLRAQAEVGLSDLAGALADVNWVRANSGGLGNLLPFASPTEAINAILREKRYSLLFESAHRLVDLRAYGRLNSTYFMLERPGDVFIKALPIPQTEADARNGAIACS